MQDLACFIVVVEDHPAQIERWMPDPAAGLPQLPGLVRIRETPPLTAADLATRRRSVAGAFDWAGPPLAGVRVVLVDDVLTTGATAEAAAAVLWQAGAAAVDVVTVATVV